MEGLKDSVDTTDCGKVGCSAKDNNFVKFNFIHHYTKISDMQVEILLNLN